jgi:hypothetical protein
VNGLSLALKRHPLAIEAHFRRSLVLTYAFPEAILRPLLPAGLDLDAYDGWGFLAIAMVQTEHLRPVGWPRFLGKNFFLTGFRIFVRFQGADGKDLRGLRILRSDADSRLMVAAGNRLTRYNYHRINVDIREVERRLSVVSRSREGRSDLEVEVDLGEVPTTPPPGSPFPDLETARRYAGPMPFTFEAEPETRSMVVVEGVRTHWHPRPVQVVRARCAFLDQPPFEGTAPILANAFLVEDVPYRWKPGRRVPLAKEAP